MPKLFLDTEFTELRQQAQLLSLALVSEDGPWFYAAFSDVDLNNLSDWHQEHVVPYLQLSPQQIAALPPQGTSIQGSREDIVPQLTIWLQQWTQIEIWADVPAYDWVLFCELFGGALHIPKSIHYMVRDLATLFILKEHDPDTDRFQFAYGQGVPSQGLIRHNALGDAISGWACWKKLTKI